MALIGAPRAISQQEAAPFANSPTLSTELLNPIVVALAAHTKRERMDAGRHHHTTVGREALPATVPGDRP